eukprot:1392713-Rhodomonas_salina.1
MALSPRTCRGKRVMGQQPSNAGQVSASRQGMHVKHEIIMVCRDLETDCWSAEAFEEGGDAKRAREGGVSKERVRRSGLGSREREERERRPRVYLERALSNLGQDIPLESQAEARQERHLSDAPVNFFRKLCQGNGRRGQRQPGAMSETQALLNFVRVLLHNEQPNQDSGVINALEQRMRDAR